VGSSVYEAPESNFFYLFIKLVLSIPRLHKAANRYAQIN